MYEGSIPSSSTKIKGSCNKDGQCAGLKNQICEIVTRRLHKNRVVYQLLRFLGLGPRGCGLESHLPYYFAPLVEFGRHSGLRNQCRNAYRFEFDRGYKRKDPIVQWIECFATDEEIGIRVLVGSLRHGYSLRAKTDGSFLIS